MSLRAKKKSITDYNEFSSFHFHLSKNRGFSKFSNFFGILLLNIMFEKLGMHLLIKMYRNIHIHIFIVHVAFFLHEL